MESLLIPAAGEKSTNLHTWALVIGGISALIALLFSILLILQHLKAYNNPAEQKWIVGVLFMVPVYASESVVTWVILLMLILHGDLVCHLLKVLSLWYPRFSMECDILRNCYEAFALYSFGNYLIACLGGEDRTIEYLKSQSSKELNVPLLNQNKTKVVGHPFPLNLIIRPWVLGQEFYRVSKFGIVQYMILKTFCAFLALVLQLCGIYGDGEFKWYYGYPYITIVLNFSQMWALYCLVQFYAVTHEELQPIRPLAKFISFKAIVFATWWQGVAIAIICSPSFLADALPNGQNFQSGLQDFLICIEMAIAAAAHIFVFPADPYHLTGENHTSVRIQSAAAKAETQEDCEKTRGKETLSVVGLFETNVEGPGTSIKESVQDLVIGGGEHVVNDVLITVSQAVEPMEKGVTKLNETFQHLSWGGKPDNNEQKIEIHDQIVESASDDISREVTVEKHIV